MKRAGSSMRRTACRRAGKPRSPSPRTSSFRTGSCCSASTASALESPHTRIELIESVLAGTDRGAECTARRPRDLQQHSAGLCGRCAGAIAHDPGRTSGAPAARARAPVDARDLRAHRQLIVRESDTLRATQGNARGDATLDGEPHVDVDRRRRAGLRLWLVSRGQDPSGACGRHAEGAADARRRRAFRRALPDLRRSRKRRPRNACGSPRSFANTHPNACVRASAGKPPDARARGAPEIERATARFG